MPFQYLIFLLSAQPNGNINNIKTMHRLTFVCVSGLLNY